MIPFCNGNAVLLALVGHGNDIETLNDDYAFYLKTAPTATPDPWPLRMLPSFVRNGVKARMEARQYEKTLITMWENSPHLLDDIGVVLSTDRKIVDGLVEAPAGVIDHVKVRTAESAAPIDPPAQTVPMARRPAKRPWATGVGPILQGGFPA